jgi:hypothetical protein
MLIFLGNGESNLQTSNSVDVCRLHFLRCSNNFAEEAHHPFAEKSAF